MLQDRRPESDQSANAADHAAQLAGSRLRDLSGREPGSRVRHQRHDRSDRHLDRSDANLVESAGHPDLPAGTSKNRRKLVSCFGSPKPWNGKLAVAGASGTRSEFNGDWAWSNFVLSKGYAYASQNKGVLNFFLSSATDPLACRLNPTSPVFVHFYDNDPGKEFTQWTQYFLKTADLAKRAVKVPDHRTPRRTYAVGTSNWGYQVRRAIEEGPNLFDGGVDWEGTFVSPYGPNLLIDLPPAIANFPAYVASGYDDNSAAAQAIRAAGYPPDVKQTLAGGVIDTLWQRNNTSFWEVTMCQWQKRLDPTYDTYGVPGLAGYNDRSSEPRYRPVLRKRRCTPDDWQDQETSGDRGRNDGRVAADQPERAYREAAVDASRKGSN